MIIGFDPILNELLSIRYFDWSSASSGTDLARRCLSNMENSRLTLARLALDDTYRLTQLNVAFRNHVAELLEEANDAGYSQREAVMSLLSVVRDLNEDPDPADDPQPPQDRAEREDIVAKSALDL